EGRASSGSPRGLVAGDGRLHWRPSRASRASAEEGPQVPDPYCSGLPFLAQNSWTGSRMRQDNSTSSWRGNNGGSPMSTSKNGRASCREGEEDHESYCDG